MEPDLFTSIFLNTAEAITPASRLLTPENFFIPVVNSSSLNTPSPFRSKVLKACCNAMASSLFLTKLTIKVMMPYCSDCPFMSYMTCCVPCISSCCWDSSSCFSVPTSSLCCCSWFTEKCWTTHDWGRPQLKDVSLCCAQSLKLSDLWLIDSHSTRPISWTRRSRFELDLGSGHRLSLWKEVHQRAWCTKWPRVTTHHIFNYNSLPELQARCSRMSLLFSASIYRCSKTPRRYPSLPLWRTRCQHHKGHFIVSNL